MGLNINGLPPGIPAEQAIQYLLQHLTPDQIAQYQSYMWKGGLYGSKPAPNLGVWGPDDLNALQTALSTVGQLTYTDDTGTHGPELMEYLRRQAAYGVYSGIANAVHSRNAAVDASGKVTVTQADPKALAQQIDAEFKALTGRKATNAEKAGFVAAYNAAYKASVIANVQADMGQAGLDLPAPPLPFTPKDKLPQIPAIVAGADPFATTNAGIAGANTAIAAQNAQGQAADQQFLALADQPMPGQPGSAGASGGLTVSTQQAWDPNAFAESYVREHAAGEVGGHDASSVFNSFLNILKG
jgi:hypothetical protein